MNLKIKFKETIKNNKKKENNKINYNKYETYYNCDDIKESKEEKNNDEIMIDLEKTQFHLRIKPYKNGKFNIKIGDEKGNIKSISKSISKENLEKILEKIKETKPEKMQKKMKTIIKNIKKIIKKKKPTIKKS